MSQPIGGCRRRDQEKGFALAEIAGGLLDEVLKGGGDPSNLLVPEAFDRAVLDFLAAVSGPSCGLKA